MSKCTVSINLMNKRWQEVTKGLQHLIQPKPVPASWVEVIDPILGCLCCGYSDHSVSSYCARCFLCDSPCPWCAVMGCFGVDTQSGISEWKYWKDGRTCPLEVQRVLSRKIEQQSSMQALFGFWAQGLFTDKSYNREGSRNGTTISPSVIAQWKDSVKGFSYALGICQIYQL